MFNELLISEKSKRKRIEDRRVEGTDLGIFFYFLSWLTVGLLFSFSTNFEVKSILDFYIRFDIIAIMFIVFHFYYSRKNHSNPDRDWLDFDELNSSDFTRGIVYCVMAFLILLVIFFILIFTIPQGNIINSYNRGTYTLLMVTRNIIVEEMVFRGLMLFVSIYAFKKLLKFPDVVSEILAVLISGFTFGFYHYFVYGNNLASLLYLTFLGIFCGILALRYGLWAAILLHEINNISSAFSGSFYSFSSLTYYHLALYILIFFIGYRIIMTFNGKKNHFFIFMGVLISGFVFGFFTNGLIHGEPGGLYFQHYHAIIFVPCVFLIVKKKLKKDIFYTILVGFIFGLFISDIYDILNQTQLELAYSILYSFIGIQIYLALTILLKKRKMEVF